MAVGRKHKNTTINLASKRFQSSAGQFFRLFFFSGKTENGFMVTHKIINDMICIIFTWNYQLATKPVPLSGKVQKLEIVDRGKMTIEWEMDFMLT